ncbi:hypothetical protein, partial [Legionella pneumophila]|uniref:hypothetical protein n=1 Tax=Legionella pneumophila TaxID=446 RepID=UPI001E325ADE
INESVSYFNEFRPLDCFVATLLATTVPKIVPYRGSAGQKNWSKKRNPLCKASFVSKPQQPGNFL